MADAGHFDGGFGLRTLTDSRLVFLRAASASASLTSAVLSRVEYLLELLDRLLQRLDVSSSRLPVSQDPA
jgi:hypothetical protein